MKKLIVILGSFSLITSSSFIAISCTNGALSSKPDWNKDKVAYELFGEIFETKEDAIKYYLDPINGLEIEKNYEYASKVYLGEKEYNSSQEMMDYIENTIKINKLYTNKNVNNFIIDGMNQLSATVVANKNDELEVYKDANGRIVYGQDYQTVINESYYNKIQEVYFAENSKFSTMNEVKEYYYRNFIDSAQEGGMKTEDLYSIGSGTYNEAEVKNELQNSIKTIYLYDNQEINEENIYLDNAFKPSIEDTNRIQMYNESPGKFFIEAKGNAEGQFTGDKIISSSSDLLTYFYDENQWNLASEEYKNLFDITQSLVSDTILSSVNFLDNVKDIIENNHDYNKLEYCFPNNNKVTSESIFGCFSGNEQYRQFNNLIEDYELTSDSSYILSELNSLESLDLINKSVIYLYQIREAFRYSQISVSDNQLLNNLFYSVIVNLTNETEQWKNFVDSLGLDNVTMALDYLVEKNDFFERMDNFSNKYEILEILDNLNAELSNSFAEQVMILAIDKAKEVIIENTAQIAPMITQELFNLVEEAISAVPIIGDIFAFIQTISLQKTLVFELIIPDTEQTLTYSITAWSWEQVDFKPEEIFNVFQIKKPINETIYFLEGRYFPNEDLATQYLKQVLIDEMIKNHNVIYYSSYFKEQKYRFDDKDLLLDTLINKVLEENKIEYTLFSDHLGGIHADARSALETLVDKLNDPEKFSKYINKYYFYNYGSISNNQTIFITKDYYEMDQFVETQVKNNWESKIVSSGDLMATQNFDELYDLSKFKTPIYHFNLFGLDYYYKDKVNATYAIMKLLNYRSSTFKITTETYKFRDLIFENKVLFLEFLNSNIKELINSEEVDSYVKKSTT